ncbi:MAG: stage III sporulation protein AC [Clostridia bacterium]|nr:stage III sporulation protein AC [Clostridia bacterium]
MDLSLLLKIAGIGMIVAVCCQVLSKIGRDEQATMVSIAGVVVVLMILVQEIGGLLDTVKEVFGI